MGLFSLSAIEKKILYRKYLQLGNSPEDANKRINEFSSYLKELKIKLNEKQLSKEDINIRFKKEFEKLCMQLDAGTDYIRKLGKKSKMK